MHIYIKKIFLATAILLSVMLVVSCESTNNPSAPEAISGNDGVGSLNKGSGPSASGQGSLTGENVRRIFAFHANTKPNGSVSGNGVLNRVSSDPNERVKIKFDIDCLSVTDKVAIMSGTITKFPQFPEAVGGPFWFKVVDNGEGKNADPDEITFFLFCTPDDDDPECDVDCEDDLGFDLNQIEAGNIQVKP